MAAEVERKSELRTALELALFKRAAKPKVTGEETYGVTTWKVDDTGRWNGEAWFRGLDGVVVKVVWFGSRNGQELGERLLASIELTPEGTK